MPEIVYRRIGETGNPLEGTLDNEDATLTIPEGASVTLTGHDTATGVAVIDGAAVEIVDRATRLVRYLWADEDLAAARTLELVFSVTIGGKPTFVPDAPAYRLRLIVW